MRKIYSATFTYTVLIICLLAGLGLSVLMRLLLATNRFSERHSTTSLAKLYMTRFLLDVKL